MLGVISGQMPCHLFPPDLTAARVLENGTRNPVEDQLQQAPVANSRLDPGHVMRAVVAQGVGQREVIRALLVNLVAAVAADAMPDENGLPAGENWHGRSLSKIAAWHGASAGSHIATVWREIQATNRGGSHDVAARTISYGSTNLDMFEPDFGHRNPLPVLHGEPCPHGRPQAAQRPGHRG